MYYINDKNQNLIKLEEKNINKFDLNYNYSDLKFLNDSKCIYYILNYNINNIDINEEIQETYIKDIQRRFILFELESMEIIGEIILTEKIKTLFEKNINKKSVFVLNNNENNKELILIKFIFNN